MPSHEYREVDKSMHRGDLRLRDRSILVRGIVSGDLYASGNSHVEMKGIVRGDVHLHGGQMFISGMVQGNVHHHDGELTVRGIVNGSILGAGIEQRSKPDGQENGPFKG